MDWQIFGDLCWYHGSRDLAINWFELALDRSEHLSSNETARIHLAIATICLEQKKVDGCRKALKNITLLDLRRDDNLRFRFQLADATSCIHEGDLKKAELEFTKLEEIEEKVSGEISFKTVLGVHKLAVVLKTMGRLEESQALYRRCCRQRREARKKGSMSQ